MDEAEAPDVPAGQPDRAADQPPAQRQRLCQQLRAMEPHAVPLSRDHGGLGRRGRRVEDDIFRGEDIGALLQPILYLSDIPCKDGNQVMPHAVAQVAQVQVGRVLPPGEPLRREQRPQVAAPAVEQRADQRRGAQRPPRPHPTRPTAAQQTQQHRLRLVITGVRHRYGGASPRGGNALEERVAHFAGRRFQREALLPGVVPHVGGLADVRQVPDRGQVFDEAGVTGRIRAQAVVQVRHTQPQPPGPGDLPQQGQQRHGVGPAGDAHHHALPRAQEAVAADRVLNGLPQKN